MCFYQFFRCRSDAGCDLEGSHTLHWDDTDRKTKTMEKLTIVSLTLLGSAIITSNKWLGIAGIAILLFLLITSQEFRRLFKNERRSSDYGNHCHRRDTSRTYRRQ